MVLPAAQEISQRGFNWRLFSLFGPTGTADT